MQQFDIFPIIEEDFVNSCALTTLLDWTKSREHLFEHHRSSIKYWDKKCIYYNEEYVPTDIKDILKQVCLGMRKYIQINLTNSRYLYSEFPQIVKWKEGDEMTPHADNIEQDNITPNASPWREFGGVLYLNSDFDGGEIYYPNIGIQVSPKPGMIVLHPAGIKYTHGVTKVTHGKRYTMSSFFTYDKNYAGFLPE
jgi:hypothetical protein